MQMHLPGSGLATARQSAALLHWFPVKDKGAAVGVPACYVAVLRDVDVDGIVSWFAT